jgi:hypothetical protein
MEVAPGLSEWNMRGCAELMEVIRTDSSYCAVFAEAVSTSVSPLLKSESGLAGTERVDVP